MRNVTTVDHMVSGVAISSGAKPALGKPGVRKLLADSPRTEPAGSPSELATPPPPLLRLLPPPPPLLPPVPPETVPERLPLSPASPETVPERFPLFSESLETVPLMFPLLTDSPETVPSMFPLLFELLVASDERVPVTSEAKVVVAPATANIIAMMMSAM